MRTYLYPQNLKASANLWLWSLRDFFILSVAVLISAVILMNSGNVLPGALSLAFGFLTIRKDETAVIDSIGYSVSRLFCVTKGVKAKLSPKQENTTVRTGISISRELLDRTDEAMKKTGARSRSDFIAEALDFYMAWLHSEETSKVLTPALESVISGRIGDTENRIARVLFKQSVELAMLMHVVAATHAVRPEDLDNLRKMCMGEVSKINGKFSFEDAVKLQKK